MFGCFGKIKALPDKGLNKKGSQVGHKRDEIQFTSGLGGHSA